MNQLSIRDENMIGHWKTMKVRRCLREHRQGYYTTEPYQDSGVRLLRITDLRDSGRVDYSESPFVAAKPDICPFLLQPFDFVFARTGGAGLFGMIETVDDPVAYASYLIRFRFHSSIVPHFLRYFFLSQRFQDALKQNIHGGVNQNVHAEDIKDQVIALPPPLDQRHIARYLDAATRKLDRLVALRLRQMELLREQRAAVFQQAVTRGLNASAPLKDSIIPWLNQIPLHWQELRIAVAVTKNTNGFVGPTRDILVEDGVRYLQSLHLKSGKIRFDKPYFVSEKWSSAHAKSILQEGDVLAVQTGDVGQVAAVPKEFEGCNCHALIILRMRRDLASGFYLAMLFNAHFGKHALMRETTGALLPHLECGKIRDIRLPFPPLGEQKEILNFIQKENAKFDALLSAYMRQLGLLAEYRAALIHECVTGQIDASTATSNERP